MKDDRKNKNKLTPKQKAFADYYIQTGNATESAIKAGYSKKTAYSIGNENLKKPEIMKYIMLRIAPTEKKRIATGDDVMIFLTKVMNGEIEDAFGLDISISDRVAAGKEILKRIVNEQKLELELIKLENQLKDTASDGASEDNFLEALNATAKDVWIDESDDTDQLDQLDELDQEEEDVSGPEAGEDE